jgi:hypothetical protein
MFSFYGQKRKRIGEERKERKEKEGEKESFE